MNKDVYYFLKLIEENENNIQNTKAVIKEETEKFEEKVSPLRENVRRSQHEVNRIRDTRIPVSLKAIVEEFAKQFGTSIDNIDVSIKSSANTYDSISPEKFISKIKENQARSKGRQDTLTFIIEARKPGNLLQSVSLTSPLILSEIQADGKPLEEHCRVKRTEILPNIYETTLEIDDYRNIILKFPIKELYSHTEKGFVAKDSKCQAIIDASAHNISHSIVD